jgi:large subunit ribosomal protein L10
MNRDQKSAIVSDLAQKLEDKKHFYLTDIEALDAETTSMLRRKCFESGIELIVVKNTLLKKALEQFGNKYEDLYGVLTHSTSIMFTETANVPARMIKELRKGKEKPVIKAAYVEESIFIGDQVEALASLKSKEELVGDIIGLLQSPAKNLISSLQSGKNILAGVVKTLAERE